MSKNTFFILGDSTSMSIGVDPCMYPFLMAENKSWPESTTLINCSQPGITSADASAFFFQHLNKYPSTRAVIVHLGTCDATSSEIHKGRYTWIRQIIHSIQKSLRIEKKRSKLHNRLLHFEWNSDLDSHLEKPEEPLDFEYNLERIIKKCFSRSIPVILVRPKSNFLFPPGVGKGNFIFYSYLGVSAKISDRLKISDVRLVKAMKLFEENQFAESAALYHEILSQPDTLSDSLEYPLMVVNNYAVAMVEAGKIEEAETLFQLLLKERGIRKEIVLYNLAHLFRKQGDLSKYNKLIEESYESDSSLYRIRKPYLEVIDRLSQKYPQIVTLIDLHKIIEDECYVDHCHPLPEGQKIIAEQMLTSLRKQNFTGHHTATIQNILQNPERALGNTTEFYSYFRTYAPRSISSISQERSQLIKQLSNASSPNIEQEALQTASEEMSRALEYYLKHPCFPTLWDALRFGPQYSSDIGRFPEFFLIRYVIPYIQIHEIKHELKNRFSPDIGLLRSSVALSRVLPPLVNELVAKTIPPLDFEADQKLISSIIEKIRVQLMSHLRQGNMIYERMKSTIFWYFRETLRYGSHSRISMRYDRTFLEFTAEALAIAGVLDTNFDNKHAKEIQDLIFILEETAYVHEKFCHQFSINNNPKNLLKEYDDQLYKIASRLEKLEELSDVCSRNISLLS